MILTSDCQLCLCEVWYEDLSGSGKYIPYNVFHDCQCMRLNFWNVRTGCETIAHLRENGRITIMFNAFEGPPRIVRLFGKGD